VRAAGAGTWRPWCHMLPRLSRAGPVPARGYRAGSTSPDRAANRIAEADAGDVDT